MPPRALGPAPRTQVERTELVRRLQARFEPGVTTIVAGAGFGKTTLLAQAMAVNAREPAGIDRLLTCSASLRTGSRFAAAVATTLGLAPSVSTSAEGVVDAALEHAARTWPLGVALLVDDAHLLHGGEGEDLLHHLLVRRPPPLHVVVASRRPIPWIGSARSGQPTTITTITEGDLRFSPAEVAALVAPSSQDATALGPLGGWPALTDLAAAFGVAGAATFVEDEVLSRFDSGERESLAAIAAVGGGDASMLETACGVALDPAEVASRLPMTTLRNGQLLVHPLWASILEGTLSVEELAATRSRVAHATLDRGDAESAATLFAEAGDWDGFDLAIGATWRTGYLGSARDVIAHWLDLLPASRRETPTGTVLRGLGARLNDGFGERTRDLLAVAVERCQEAGTTATEMVALGEYAYVCRARGELDRLVPVLDRLGVLARSGVPEARPFIALAEAAIFDVAGDDVGVLRVLAQVGPDDLSDEWSAAVAFLRVNALASLGETDELEATASECRRLAGPDAALGRYTTAMVAWRLGRPEHALQMLPSLPSDEDLSRVDRVAAAIPCALVEAMAGRVTEAEACIGIARVGASETAHPAFDGQLSVAIALLRLAQGDPVGATAELRDLIERRPLAEGGERLLRSGAASAYVLLPEVRPVFDAAPLGPGLRAHLEVGRAVAATFDESVSPPSSALSPDLVLCAVPLPYSVRLASWAHARRDPLGASLAARMVAVHGQRGRNALRGGAEDPDPRLARAARDLSSLVSVPPAEQLHLQLLGPVVLRRDGMAVEHPDWDRDLVRALACLLALRGPLPRASAAAQLWPDTAPDVAARNLRTHLGLLRGVLEPSRLGGEASFLLRTDGDLISLAGPPHLTVDAHLFIAALDEAAPEASGRAEVDAALRRWVGRPMTGLPELEWVDEERDALRERFVTASLGDGRASLAGSMPERTIVRATDVLQVDPWSEQAYQLLVAAHAAAHDRAAARRALQRCRTMLDELGAEPSPDTVALTRRLRAGDPLRADGADA